jgi:hypothetical protein
VFRRSWKDDPDGMFHVSWFLFTNITRKSSTSTYPPSLRLVLRAVSLRT